MNDSKVLAAEPNTVIQVHAGPLPEAQVIYPEPSPMPQSRFSRSRDVKDWTMLFNQHPPARSELKTRRSPKERFYHDRRQAMFNESKARMEERFGSF